MSFAVFTVREYIPHGCYVFFLFVFVKIVAKMFLPLEYRSFEPFIC